MKRFLAPVLAVLMAFACSGDVPTEATTAFAKGGLPALEIVEFSVDKSAAHFLETVNVSGRVSATMKYHERLHFGVLLGPVYAFRGGETCEDLGYDTPCTLFVETGCLSVGYAASFSCGGRIRCSRKINLPGPAGDVCYTDAVPVPGDYELTLLAYLRHTHGHKRIIVEDRRTTPFTLLD
jgi:hypothetical protein